MTVLTPGFADAGQAQTCFRAVLRAMSFPGRAVTVGIALPAPQGLSPAAAAVLLTLADASVAVHLQDERAADWLVFHTGTRLAAADTADFVVASTQPRLADLAQGSDEEPEGGTTLILEVPALEGGQRARLTGPGIESALIVDLPIDREFFAAWQDMSARAPCGVDVLLCAGTQLLALPRSLHLERL
jgi:alpha-D-ribose 1-methylphosphonate 5-triphosphate synthase subunit PhnH